MNSDSRLKGIWKEKRDARDTRDRGDIRDKGRNAGKTAPAILLCIVILLTGCGESDSAKNKSAGPNASAAEGAAPADIAAGKELRVYMWSEYIDPAIPEQFEKETGIPVRIDVYEDTETMIAKLQHQGGDRIYDIVIASDHAIPVLAKFGLIRPLDLDKIPNAKNLGPKFRNAPYDPEAKHSLPYQWGTVGLVYRKDRIPDFEPTWALLFDPAQQPEGFVLIDSMRDMMSVALKHRGQSINSVDPDQVKAAGDQILAAKKSAKCLGFEGGVGGKNKVAGGMAALAVVYSGDALRARDEDPQLGYAIPKEGSVIWVDAMTVASRAPNPEAAWKFMNYLLDAKVGAQLSNWTRYGTPNEASMPMIEESMRNDPAIYPPDDVMRKLEFIHDVGNDTRLYDEVWRAVKSR